MNNVRRVLKMDSVNLRVLWSVLLLLMMSGVIHAQGAIPGKPNPNSLISLSVKDASIEQVLSLLEKKSFYTFLYKSEELRNKERVNLDVKNKNFKQVLNEILNPVNLSYEIDDEVIVIKPGKTATSVQPANSRPVQERMITGTVTDEEGLPLPGTTVYVKGLSNRKVLTDDKGVYNIFIPAGSDHRLVFSFIGMETREIAVNDQVLLNVQLTMAENTLEEAVIVGAYGMEQKRSDLVGSVYQVDNARIKNLPAQRIDNLLEGLVPGLTVNPNTDAAVSTRSRYNVRIRGAASLAASNEPLWIIDGVRAFTGDRTNMIPGVNTSVSPLSFLSSEDIESITVLKDATMTSIYGADGANGVILVTTKKGRRSPSMNASVRLGTSRINESTRFKVLNGAQYMELAKESYLNVPGNNDLTYFPYQDLPNNPYSATNTDWTDMYYGGSNYVQSNISFGGGGEKSSHYLSATYYDSQSTVKGNRQQRMALRGNVDVKLSSKLSLALNMGSSYNINDIFNPGSDYFELIPIISPYNEDGSYRLRYDRVARMQDSETGSFFPGVESIKFFNSVAEREQNDNMQRTFASMNSAILKYDIMDGLSLSSQFGADYQSAHEETYSARANWSGMNISTGEPVGYSSRSHANFLLWTWVERLNFHRSYGKHNVSGLLAFEAHSRRNKSVSARGAGFANDHIKEVSYAADISSAGSSNSETKMASFFGQVNYGYDERFFVSLNARKDGNSDFGEDVRWGNFWSVGASWNIHNEETFQSDLVQVFKLKASFGTNGNSRLGSQQAKGLYGYNPSDNYMGVPGASMETVWNRDLSWERTYMTNAGLRVNFANRVDVDLEVYNNKTVDMLSDLVVSRTTGDTRVVRNVGSIQNRGIELTVESTNIRRSDFEWRTDANISHNGNKLLELYNGIPSVRGEKLWIEGEDVDRYYLVRWAGVDPRDGAPLWYDYAGNLTRVFNIESDRVLSKSSSPLLTGGISNSIIYKGWSLRALATYSVGGYAFSSFGRNVSSDGLNIISENQSVNQLDRWQRPGDLALAPKPVWNVGNNNSTRNSTRYLYNTTHLRLKNIALEYQVNDKWLEELGIKSGSVFFLVDNIGVWTPYDQSDKNSYRQSMSGYPMETTFSLGLNINL